MQTKDLKDKKPKLYTAGVCQTNIEHRDFNLLYSRNIIKLGDFFVTKLKCCFACVKYNSVTARRHLVLKIFTACKLG